MLTNVDKILNDKHGFVNTYFLFENNRLQEREYNCRQMFNEWLLQKLQEMNWKQADLARHSGITRAAISNYINGRIPDDTALNKIARAFKLPPEIVFRAAGHLPPQSAKNEIIEKITHITQGLSSQDQEDILEFAKLRKNLSEKRENEAKRTTRHSTVTK